MVSDLKFVLRSVFWLWLIAEVFSVFGVTSSPIGQLMVHGQNGYLLAPFRIPLLFTVVLYLFSAPRAKEALVVLGGGILISTIYFYFWQTPTDDHTRNYRTFTIPCVSFGLAALCAFFLRVLNPVSAADKENVKLLLGCAVFIGVFSQLTRSYLQITQVLHPATFDLHAFHFDLSLGLNPSAAAVAYFSEKPALLAILDAAYDYFMLGFAMLYAYQVRHQEGAAANILKAWAVGSIIGILLYQLCPVTGPAYAFGSDYPARLPLDPFTVPFGNSVVPPVPRNGIPSLHFGWALLLWVNAAYTNQRFWRNAAAILALLTGLATLAIREHYLVDLVVSVPFVLAVQAISIREVTWQSSARVRAVAVGLGLCIAWAIAIRYGVPVFKAIPGLSWLAVASTILVCSKSFVSLRDARESQTGEAARIGTVAAQVPLRDHKDLLIAALFVTSGFAGLVYQVVFSKSLGLAFGSMATATYAVLATYMGGMAFGAWIGGILAARAQQPLVLYAFCELLIGLYCAATPAIFGAAQTLYISMASGLPPDAGHLIAMRVIVSAGTLFLPTVLMGATLPLLVAFLKPRAGSLGVPVAWLYCANTLGAAFGALLAGYAILPTMGVAKSTLIAAALSLLVALGAIELHKRFATTKGFDASADLDSAQAFLSSQTHSRNAGRWAIIALTVGGSITLGLEVLYMHMLAIIAGNSAYAFSLMLFAFLIGLASGAEAGRRLLKIGLEATLLQAGLLIALGIMILIGVFQWMGMPDYFENYGYYSLTLGFGAREVVRATVCIITMLPPAFLIGALYPISMEIVGKAWPTSQVTRLGQAAALNTVGNIAGVLIVGFVMLPTIGALKSIQILAGLAIALSAAVWFVSKPQRSRMLLVPAGIALVVVFLQPHSFDYTKFSTGANVYFHAQAWGTAIDHAESADGGLTTVTERLIRGVPNKTLLTNGKFQGNNALGGEMQAQIGIAVAPLLHTPHRQSALVIGYGTGVSARIFHDANFKSVDIAELSQDIVDLANRHFSQLNARVSDAEGVRTYVTDGRNFLLLQDRRYDVISMEISSIWFAGASSLYNREFYQIAKKRMTPNGVLQQWIQLHHITPLDIVRVLSSIRAEFKYVWLYSIGGQGVIVSTNDPNAIYSAANVSAIQNTSSMKPLLEIFSRQLSGLERDVLFSPLEVDRIMNDYLSHTGIWLSTDDNLALEYSTPKGNALPPDQTTDAVAEWVLRYRKK